ncbi:MAG: hypothetical protein V3W18_03225 [candidate division Zixibacteria bacterium]
MKRSIIAILFVLFLGTSVFAQYAAQLSPAGCVLKGSSKGGGYVGIYDGAFGVLGQYRIGIGGYSDLGFKAGIIDLESNSGKGDIGISLGVDTKYQVMEVRIMDPVDLSIAGVFELVKFNHFSNLSIGGAVIGSYPVELKNGRQLNPYGRLLLGFERSNQSWAGSGGSSTDFNLTLNMGCTLELSGNTEAMAEIQIDSDVAALVMGLSFGL